MLDFPVQVPEESVLKLKDMVLKPLDVDLDVPVFPDPFVFQ